MRTGDKMDNEIKTELKKLVYEIYQEGYYCGLSDDIWFDAFALAAFKIANGEKYIEYITIDCKHEIELLSNTSGC